MPTSDQSLMRQETLSTPAKLQQQRLALQPQLIELAKRLCNKPPRLLVTCGRGSSDHAGVFIRYLFETTLGIPSTSATPSVLSIYQTHARLDDTLVILISQSGQSPDLVQYAQAARASGALTVGLINQDGDTPLGQHCDHTLPLHAGPERSVAATKSWLATLYAAMHLLAHWTQSAQSLDELEALPEQMLAAQAHTWPQATEALCKSNNMLVLGRGPGLGLSNEIALKFKETCLLHAESFSAAEVLHGPLAIAGPSLPVLIFDSADRASKSIQETVQRLQAAGSPVLHAASRPLPDCIALETLSGLSPWSTLMTQAQSAYLMVEQLAWQRGHNPDTPSHIAKVTKTL